MAKFRCKASGNIIEFKNNDDIESMRKEPQYEEVVEEVAKEVIEKVVEKPAKKVGRPSKK